MKDHIKIYTCFDCNDHGKGFGESEDIVCYYNSNKWGIHVLGNVIPDPDNEIPAWCPRREEER